MVREAQIVISRKEAADLLLLLSHAKNKLTGKFKTMAEKYWRSLEDVMLKDIAKEIREKHRK